MGNNKPFRIITSLVKVFCGLNYSPKPFGLGARIDPLKLIAGKAGGRPTSDINNMLEQIIAYGHHNHLVVFCFGLFFVLVFWLTAYEWGHYDGERSAVSKLANRDTYTRVGFENDESDDIS